jgi:hypothetical protein
MTADGTIAIWDVPQPDDTATDVIVDASALFLRLTSTARCYRSDEYTTWLTAAGFTDVHAECGPTFVLVTGRT